MSLKHSSITDIPGPWSHRMLHVRGQRLHVAECGKDTNPLVLFIHGSTGGWFEWRRVLPLLVDTDVHLAAVSLRGYAPSDRTPKGYSPDVAADDVAGVIRALGHRSAIIVGQGFGAWVGWTLHARQPASVRYLVGCGASHPLAWSAQMKQPWTRGFYGTLARTARRNFTTSWSSLPTRLQRRLRGKDEAKAKVVDRLVEAAMSDTGLVTTGVSVTGGADVTSSSEAASSAEVASGTDVTSKVDAKSGADVSASANKGPSASENFVDTELGKETAQLMRESLSAGAIYPALEHRGWWVKPWPPSLVRWLTELGQVELPPSILLVGSNDLRAPIDLVTRSLPQGSEPIIISGAGHYLPVEAPEAVAQAVLAAIQLHRGDV